jgi:alkylated DNA repair protein alkB family protein 1
MARKKKFVPPADSSVWQNQTAFRVMERKCKRKDEFEQGMLANLEDAKKIPLQLFGKDKDALLFESFPGFLVVKDAISQELQRDIIQEALENWAKPPNVSNLDLHFKLPQEGIWNSFSNWKRNGTSLEIPMIQKRHFADDTGNYQEDQENATATKESLVSDATEKNMCKLSLAQANKQTAFQVDQELNLVIDKPVDQMLKQEDAPMTDVLPRLRWLTLGHQYNWTKKEYHFDRVPPFPSSLSDTTFHIVKAIESLTNYGSSRWKPEAGIVNFYQVGDSLMAHQDRSEINTEAPLLSISIGLDCVFLMGTEDRNEKPIALKLSSGDLIVMYGKGRRAFHGVPRVFPGTAPTYLQNWDPLFSEYISHTRININIRQVY